MFVFGVVVVVVVGVVVMLLFFCVAAFAAALHSVFARNLSVFRLCYFAYAESKALKSKGLCLQVWRTRLGACKSCALMLAR